MDYAYPYFEAKGVERAALYATYAPQADSAKAYWRVVAHMLAELDDGHTGLLSPSARSGRRYFAACRAIGGAMVVDQAGQIARAAGLGRGDGRRPWTVGRSRTRWPHSRRSCATPQHRWAKAAFCALSTTGDALTVTVIGPAGERTVAPT